MKDVKTKTKVSYACIFTYNSGFVSLKGRIFTVGVCRVSGWVGGYERVPVCRILCDRSREYDERYNGRREAASSSAEQDISHSPSKGVRHIVHTPHWGKDVPHYVRQFCMSRSHSSAHELHLPLTFI